LSKEDTILICNSWARPFLKSHFWGIDPKFYPNTSSNNFIIDTTRSIEDIRKRVTFYCLQIAL
jgi:hypothetical protein